MKFKLKIHTILIFNKPFTEFEKSFRECSNKMQGVSLKINNSNISKHHFIASNFKGLKY